MGQEGQALGAIEPEPEYIACFLCEDMLLIKYSKRDKPYFICDGCGVQAFIRREKGIKRLKRVITGNTLELNSTLELISQREMLEIKLGEIQNGQFWSLFGDLNLDIQEKAVKAELSRITAELKKKSGKPGN